MATAFVRELQRQRSQLLRTEKEGAAELIRVYEGIYRRLRVELRDVVELIAEADEPNVSWLVQQERYRHLLHEVEREAWAFGRQASEIVANQQRGSLATVNANVRRLVELSFPAAIRPDIATRFVALNADAVARLVSFASDGNPLATLLAKIAPEAVQQTVDTLAYGVASGQHPSVIARELRSVASVPLDRALTISRTEVLRSYRSAALDLFQANPTVTGWTWVATFDTRTCCACWAMAGTDHMPTEPMAAHVRCRCTMAPKTVSPAELGFKDVADTRPTFELGEDVFKRLSPADQRTILGPGKHDLYRDGKIKLSDTVKRDRSPTWGDSFTEASIKDSLAHAA